MSEGQKRGLIDRIPGWVIIGFGVVALAAAVLITFKNRKSDSSKKPAAVSTDENAKPDLKKLLSEGAQFNEKYTREDWYKMFQQSFFLPVMGMTIEHCMKYAPPCAEADKYLIIVKKMLEQGWSRAEINAAVEIFRQGMPPPVKVLPEGISCDIAKSTVRNDFFIMSRCPAGTQYIKILEGMIADLGDALDWHPHYIVTLDEKGNLQSLHGPQELAEDKRQACILKMFGRNTWLRYMRCYVDSEMGREDCAAQMGISGPPLRECVDGSEIIDYLRKEMELSKLLHVQASPTAVFNCGKALIGARPYQIIKPMLCQMLGEDSGVPACRPAEMDTSPLELTAPQCAPEEDKSQDAGK